MDEVKEWKQIANFYDESEHGFIDKRGFAAIPLANSKTKLAIYHQGRILKECRNEQSAKNFIDKYASKKSVSQLPL